MVFGEYEHPVVCAFTLNCADNLGPTLWLFVDLPRERWAPRLLDLAFATRAWSSYFLTYFVLFPRRICE